MTLWRLWRIYKVCQRGTILGVWSFIEKFSCQDTCYLVLCWSLILNLGESSLSLSLSLSILGSRIRFIHATCHTQIPYWNTRLAWPTGDKLEKSLNSVFLAYESKTPQILGDCTDKLSNSLFNQFTHNLLRKLYKSYCIIGLTVNSSKVLVGS